VTRRRAGPGPGPVFTQPIGAAPQHQNPPRPTLSHWLQGFCQRVLAGGGAPTALDAGNRGKIGRRRWPARSRGCQPPLRLLSAAVTPRSRGRARRAMAEWEHLHPPRPVAARRCRGGRWLHLAEHRSSTACQGHLGISGPSGHNVRRGACGQARRAELISACWPPQTGVEGNRRPATAFDQGPARAFTVGGDVRSDPIPAAPARSRSVWRSKCLRPARAVARRQRCQRPAAA